MQTKNEFGLGIASTLITCAEHLSNSATSMIAAFTSSGDLSLLGNVWLQGALLHVEDSGGDCGRPAGRNSGRQAGRQGHVPRWAIIGLAIRWRWSHAHVALGSGECLVVNSLGIMILQLKDDFPRMEICPLCKRYQVPRPNQLLCMHLRSSEQI